MAAIIAITFYLLIGGCVAKVEVSELEELRSSMMITQLALSQQAQVLFRMVNGTERVQSSCLEETCCPYPYQRVLDECFYLSTEKLSWSHARQYCHGMKGTLAMPINVYALESFVHDKGGSVFVWLGATDEGQEGEWKWLNGRPIKSEDWSGSQPDNYDGNEHCMDLRPEWHPPLNDARCSNKQRFACQYTS
nr:perlucin-like isoform X2 [Cherax quadricarinatus]